MAKQEISVSQPDGEVVVTEYKQMAEPVVKPYSVKDGKLEVAEADVPLVLRSLDGAKPAAKSKA